MSEWHMGLLYQYLVRHGNGCVLAWLWHSGECHGHASLVCHLHWEGYGHPWQEPVIMDWLAESCWVWTCCEAGRRVRFVVMLPSARAVSCTWPPPSASAANSLLNPRPSQITSSQNLLLGKLLRLTEVSWSIHWYICRWGSKTPDQSLLWWPWQESGWRCYIS